MADHNVFAFTGPTPQGGYYPEYISVNERDGKLVLSVRSEDEHSSSEIALDKEKARGLYVALMHWLIPTDKA